VYNKGGGIICVIKKIAAIFYCFVCRFYSTIWLYNHGRCGRNGNNQLVGGKTGNPRIGGMNHPVWISDLTPQQRDTAFGNGEGQLGLLF